MSSRVSSKKARRKNSIKKKTKQENKKPYKEKENLSFDDLAVSVK